MLKQTAIGVALSAVLIAFMADVRPPRLFAGKVSYPAVRTQVHAAAAMPTDPLFESGRWLHWDEQMDLTGASRRTQGEGVTVAVVDTGADFTVPDLRGAAWTNPDEIPGNKRDDDHNGYVDDIHGVSVLTSGKPYDFEGHGTAVAGIIAARPGREGTAGVAPKAKIMAVQALADDKNGDMNAVAKGIRYAVDEGADVINLSLSGDRPSRPLLEALAYAGNHRVFIVAATGNEHRDIDRKPTFPAALKADNIISVAAVTDRRTISSYSNYGADTVDVGAYGDRIVVAHPDGRFVRMSGTSMATPQVTGIAALLASTYPERIEDFKRALIASVSPTAKLRPFIRTAGVPNALAALNWMAARHGGPQLAGTVRLLADAKGAGRGRMNVRASLSGAGARQVKEVEARLDGPTDARMILDARSTTLTSVPAGRYTVTVSARSNGRILARSRVRARVR